MSQPITNDHVNQQITFNFDEPTTYTYDEIQYMKNLLSRYQSNCKMSEDEYKPFYVMWNHCVQEAKEGTEEEKTKMKEDLIRYLDKGRMSEEKYIHYMNQLN